MKLKFTLLFIIAIIIGCSEDSTDNKAPSSQINSEKPATATVQTKPKEPYPNSPAIQDLNPDSHVSGVNSSRLSGAISKSEHISGQ